MEIRRGDTCKRKEREREKKVECASRGERTKLKKYVACVCVYNTDFVICSYFVFVLIFVLVRYI